MNRFEQLIEYVINDEEAKAKELFHDIVVEKSREIYENLMQEESEEELDEAKDEESEEEELDEAAEEEIEEGMMGGDAADDLIDDVEMEEESDINMEAEGEEDIDVDMEAGDDHHSDVGGEEELEDRVMDLEDKLDELMAEFETLMGDDAIAGDGDDFGADEGGDAIEMDDTEEMMPMAEAISLKAAPKPTTSEEGGVNKKSVNADNAGATGMAGKPVHPTGTEAKGRPAPTTKDLISDFQNKAGAGMKNQSPATKPVTAQASGVNTRTPFPKG
jgi:hypothetical protein